MNLNVKFWHFLTPPHYTNSQNSLISFEFLGQELSNFVSLPRKLKTCTNITFTWQQKDATFLESTDIILTCACKKQRIKISDGHEIF